MTDNKSEELVSQAMQLISTNQFDQANNLLTQAIEADPENGGVNCMLAYVAHRQGQPEQSLVLIQKALSQGITDPQKRLYLSQLYHETGQLDNAAAILEDILSHNPGNAALLARLSNVLQDSQKIEAWRQTLLQIQKSEPNTLNPAVILYTLTNLLFSYWLQGDLAQCAAYAQLIGELKEKSNPESLGKRHLADSELAIGILQYLSEHNHEYQHGIDDRYTTAVVGDNNVLPLCHIPVQFTDHPHVLKSHWVKSCSMTALASPSANNIKMSFDACLRQLEEGQRLLVVVGNEDCEPGSQLFTRLLNGAAPIEESCQVLVQAYLDFVQQAAASKNLKVTIVGIQAPYKNSGLPEALQSQQLAMVQKLNKYLVAETGKRDLEFSDLYKVSADPNGGYVLKDQVLNRNFLKPSVYKSGLDQEAAH